MARSSDRGARDFIYPAQRHRASARAKALYGALIHAAFRSALSSLRFQPRQISSLINLIFHSVQIFLNKPRRAYIFATFHSAILLMELNSLQFRWPLFFVALPRSTNGGSVSSGCADGEVIARCGGTPSLVPRSWQVSRIRRSFQSKIHKFMNSQVNMGKPSEIGGESASASTRSALRALKHVISSAPRRLTESEVALLRQSKREVAHRVKQLVHSEG